MKSEVQIVAFSAATTAFSLLWYSMNCRLAIGPRNCVFTQPAYPSVCLTREYPRRSESTAKTSPKSNWLTRSLAKRGWPHMSSRLVVTQAYFMVEDCTCHRRRATKKAIEQPDVVIRCRQRWPDYFSSASFFSIRPSASWIFSTELAYEKRT